jgi:transcriptional regulator with XRE-family HTH domain
MAGEREFLKALGRRIRQLRTQRGWSQEHLADRAGLHRTYISSVEQGRRNLAILNVRGLAKAFGLSLAEFFAGIR